MFSATHWIFQAMSVANVPLLD